MAWLTIVLVGFTAATAGTALADPPPSAWQPIVSDSAGAKGHEYTVTQPTNVTGVLALLSPTGIPQTGTGQLVWNASADTLSWRGGPEVAISLSVSASYELPEPSPAGNLDLIAVVTAGGLPAVSASDTLTVAESPSTAGFGNEYADAVHNAAVYDGDMYIGLYNREADIGSVLRSADGTNWVKAAPDSFGQESCHDSLILGVCHIDSFAVFNGDLYAGTDTGQIWRTADGTLWTQASPSLPLHENITDMATFNGTLFATQANGNSTGGAVYATTNGTTWTEQLAFPNQGVYPEFLQVFNNQLYADAGSYAGTFFGGGPGGPLLSSADGNSWSQSVAAGFGDADNSDLSGMAVFNGDLYVATFNETQGGQVWRSPDGSNWTEVASNGFGDPDNAIIHQLAVYDNELYAGTENNVAGGEIWRTSDGTDWTLANVPGFGTGKQMRIRSFFTLGGYLFADGENDCAPPVVDFTGCHEGGWELWRLAPSPPTCQVTSISATVSGQYTAGDTEVATVTAPAGLASISNVQASNGIVYWSVFQTGTTAPVSIASVRLYGGSPTTWSFAATDALGQTTDCS